MQIEQIYTKCLAQGAYYIRSGEEAAIIDPLREVQPYIERAKQDGVTIKYIFETHFHADFVSGHVTLSEQTGASIVYGPNAATGFKSHIAEDGELFKIGNISIIALHTPGHTMESTTYLLRDENGKDIAIFTGDTLFLGDVGRPDLAQKGADRTQEDLAGMLYDSLRKKIMPLADDVMVFPAHGAGSACGKNMMKITKDTLGNQKQFNYALRADMTKTEFVKEVTDGLQAPPAYFPLNVQLNKEGYESIETILNKGMNALSPDAFEQWTQKEDVLILDVRKPADFAKAHIPNSIFIGLDGSFAPWVGELIVDIHRPILLVVPEERAKEAVTRLARVGFDNTLAYLDGGIEAWKAADKAVASVPSITTMQFASIYNRVKKGQLFDVRKCSEYNQGHVEHAIHISLSEVASNVSIFNTKKINYIYCAGGYRSMIACSILKAKGIHKVTNVEGGYNALVKTDIPKVEIACV